MAQTPNAKVKKAIADIARTLMSKDPKLTAEKAIVAARVLFFKKNKEESKMTIIENVKLNFTPNYEIKESGENKQGKWLKIGGIALTEGVSRNKNKYTFKNLQENHGRKFKWLFGHPDDDGVEEHIVGTGELNQSGKNLFHEGKIRNTARHPDVVESVRDGFVGPSIHASAKKITREEGVYLVEGLEIDGVGLVGFQGVKTASIDYAIAESFDLKESSDGDVKELKQHEVNKMAEEEQPKVEPEAAPEAPAEEKKEEAPSEEKSEEAPAQESLTSEEIKSLREELTALKNARKNDLVESVLKVNKELEKEGLMKESEDKLKLILEYETKLSRTESVGVVESEKPAEAGIVEEAGDFTMSKEAYAKFNAEIRERVR
jgi:hypothetical protein|tara:strand:- start:3337 stop:4461 length:1125 start_codon:yes stop_codon:yes gene_type:complete